MSEVEFGRYVLMQPLGEGGQGRVFLARRVSDVVGGWPVVIKLAHESAVHDPTERKRFFEEAERAIRLGSGPSIVGVTDVDIHDGVPYIVMEYDDGCDLRRIMWHHREKAKRPIPLSIVCSILGDMAEGLHFAHFGREVGDGPLGLVHRDVKPANTLVTYRGYARLLDFGISTTRADEKTGRTQYGTPRYMSQDHFYCRVNPSMDVYSLSVVAWEMLEGRTFRDGQPGFSGDFPWAVINLEPPPMSRSDLPADIVGLVSAGLAPSARPSAQEFMTVVRRYLQGDQERQQVKSMVETVLGRRARTHHTRYMEVPESLREDDAGSNDDDDDVTVARPLDPEPEPPTMMALAKDADDEVTVARPAAPRPEPPPRVESGSVTQKAAPDPDVPSFFRRERNARPVEETMVLPSAETVQGRFDRSSNSETEVLPPPRATPVRVSSMGPDERAETREFDYAAETPPVGESEHRRSGKRFMLFLVVGALVALGGAFAVAAWLLGGSA